MGAEDISENPQFEFCEPLEDEMLLIEDADEYIGPSQIIARRLDVALYRTNLPPQAKYSVRQIFSARTGHTRSIDLLSPIRAELEIESLGRNYLTAQLITNVKSFPLVLFIDGFGLYRNMYRSLTGVYIMSAALTIDERKKSSNAHTVTLGPHGSDLKEVMTCLRTSLGALDRGSILEINEEKQAVWAPILAFLGDTKQ